MSGCRAEVRRGRPLHSEKPALAGELPPRPPWRLAEAGTVAGRSRVGDPLSECRPAEVGIHACLKIGIHFKSGHPQGLGQSPFHVDGMMRWQADSVAWPKRRHVQTRDDRHCARPHAFQGGRGPFACLPLQDSRASTQWPRSQSSGLSLRDRSTWKKARSSFGRPGHSFTGSQGPPSLSPASSRPFPACFPAQACRE